VQRPSISARSLDRRNDGHVHAFHFGDHLLDVLTLCGWIEFGRTLVLHPAGGSFFYARVGGRELWGVWTHGNRERADVVHRVNVDVDDGTDIRVGVLRDPLHRRYFVLALTG